MAIVRNHRSYPLDLTGGHVLGPGETTNVDLSNEHEAALLAAGALVVVDPDTPPPAPITPPGNWLSTRESVAGLPTSGNNDGDVRLVRADRTPYVYDAGDHAWTPLSAQSGNARVLLWDDTAADYLPASYRTDTSQPREFVGPTDPATLGTITGPVFGDRWTPTQEPTA